MLWIVIKTKFICACYFLYLEKHKVCNNIILIFKKLRYVKHVYTLFDYLVIDYALKKKKLKTLIILFIMIHFNKHNI